MERTLEKLRQFEMHQGKETPSNIHHACFELDQSVAPAKRVVRSSIMTVGDTTSNDVRVLAWGRGVHSTCDSAPNH